jgi:hypothetical protein
MEGRPSDNLRRVSGAPASERPPPANLLQEKSIGTLTTTRFEEASTKLF